MQQKCTLFPERLTELRERAKLSRQQLADKLGVSRASLEYYEKGKRTPDIDILYRLSDYFNVTSDYLIGRTDKIGESTDVNAICEYTGLSGKAVKELNSRKLYNEDSIKIINFLMEEIDCKGDENGLFMNFNLIDSMYNYFFYDYSKRFNSDDALWVTSLGDIFSSMEQYEKEKKKIIKDFRNTDLSEIKLSPISKNEVLDNVYINRIIDQLKITKQRFKDEHNGND